MRRNRRRLVAEIDKLEQRLGVVPTVTFPNGASKLSTGWIISFEHPNKRRDRELYSVERVDQKDGVSTTTLRSLMGSPTR